MSRRYRQDSRHCLVLNRARVGVLCWYCRDGMAAHAEQLLKCLVEATADGDAGAGVDVTRVIMYLNNQQKWAPLLR